MTVNGMKDVFEIWTYRSRANVIRSKYRLVEDKVLAAMEANPERGGVAICCRYAVRPLRFVWDRSRDIVVTIGAGLHDEQSAVEPLDEAEIVWTIGRLRVEDLHQMFPDAVREFRNWADRYVACKYEFWEIVAASQSQKFVALTPSQWPTRRHCLIFGERSWIICEHPELETARIISGPGGGSMWIVCSRDFKRLFARELEMLANDRERCLPVLSALRYPDLALSAKISD